MCCYVLNGNRMSVCVCAVEAQTHNFFNQDIFGIELGKQYNENNIRGPGVKSSSHETSPVEPLVETQTKISLFLSIVLHTEFNKENTILFFFVFLSFSHFSLVVSSHIITFDLIWFDLSYASIDTRLKPIYLGASANQSKSIEVLLIVCWFRILFFLFLFLNNVNKNCNFHWVHKIYEEFHYTFCLLLLFKILFPQVNWDEISFSSIKLSIGFIEIQNNNWRNYRFINLASIHSFTIPVICHSFAGFSQRVILLFWWDTHSIEL